MGGVDELLNAVVDLLREDPLLLADVHELRPAACKFRSQQGWPV